MKKIKFALCQFKSLDKLNNIKMASKYIDRAAERGAQMIHMPGSFGTLNNTHDRPEFFEGGPSKAPLLHILQKKAKEHKVWVTGGTMEEVQEDGRNFRATPIINPEGEVVTIHRKLYMHDVSFPEFSDRESEKFTLGNQITTFEALGTTIGIGSCFDIRFPELSLAMSMRGATIQIFPGSFSLATGPTHLRPLAIARAIDSRGYVVVPCCASNYNAKT